MEFNHTQNITSLKHCTAAHPAPSTISVLCDNYLDLLLFFVIS